MNHVDPTGLFWGWLKRFFNTVFGALKSSKLARRIAIKFVFSFVTSGGNIGVAIRSIIPDILGALGLAPPRFAVTPAWNPDLPYPVTYGGIGSLTRYVILNLLLTAKNQFPCPPNVNQLLARFSKFLVGLLEKESGHQTDAPLENGGWIYQRKNGEIFFLRVEKFGGGWRRSSGTVDFSNPPSIPGARVVGRAHTHPYTKPTQDIIKLAGGAGGEPSVDDKLNSELGHLPSLVVHQIGQEADGRGLFRIEAASPNIW